jgi:hypothetical protein
MQFENTAFCFLISVQFSRVNNQGMLISGVKKIKFLPGNGIQCILYLDMQQLTASYISRLYSEGSAN